MKPYRQLTEEDRIDIYALKQAGKKQKQIAAHLGVSPSTISRELARNTGLKGYRPKQAHQFALERRHTARKAVKMTPETITYIETRIRQEHSPEQIAQHMKRDPNWTGPSVSHERIYQHIWQDKAGEGTLHRHLRIVGTKKKRKRRNSRDTRGRIPHRVGIEKRPKIVAPKIRIGDWEGDTIVGKNHQGALVTLVDRKSKFTLIGKVQRYTAQAVTETIIQLMDDLPRPHHTLTVDNGKEFADHQTVAQTLNLNVYFADPYSAWQRGVNENTNGLIRQYVPKGTDLNDLTESDIQHIMERLNHRPRKTLGFLTPHEVFCQRKKIAG